MVYEISRIARDVRIAIDENQTNKPLFDEEDTDTLSLDDIIRSKIVESVRRVLTIAPLHLIDCGVSFGDSVFWRSQFSGWILLPDDFMRLFIFRMSDWERPVYEAIAAADPRYQLQFSRYKGIRGNPQKPVVAIVNRSEGRALEFFSCKDDSATVEQAVYIPYPRPDRNGGIDIPERCYKAVVYEAAALAMATTGHNDMSANMSELSKQLLI